MKLFRAEAYLVKNLPEKAIDDLNDIRERSGLILQTQPYNGRFIP